MKAPSNENWLRKIKFKPQGFAFILVILIVSVFLVVAGSGFYDPEIRLIFSLMYLVMFIIFAILVIQFFSFRLLVGASGFYFRTNPFNGKYYLYKEIISCKIDRQELGNGDVRKPRSYNFYFTFTDKDNKKHEFQFTPALHREIIEALDERIKQYK